MATWRSCLHFGLLASLCTNHVTAMRGSLGRLGAKDAGHPFLVIQLNALQDSLAMNTQTRNMVVDEEAMNKILPPEKNWKVLHAALSDAQGAGSGLGQFHRTNINNVTKANPYTVRYAFDPSMFLGLSECVMDSQPVPQRKHCAARERYLPCVRSGTVPCVYGDDQAGPAVVIWELEKEAIFPGDASIRVPTLLWVRDDSGSEDAGLTDFQVHLTQPAVKGKLVKTLWGRLRSELLDQDVARRVYEEILRVNLRLSWSYRAPYFLTLLTNDWSEAGACAGEKAETRFCQNMKERYFPAEMNRRPAVVMLEEIEDPMVRMKVIPSLKRQGDLIDFHDAMGERGYSCMRFQHDLLVCWNSGDFVFPYFTTSELDFLFSTKIGQPLAECISGYKGAAACNVCFNELITRLPRGQALNSSAEGKLEDLSKTAPHAAALLRLQHRDSGSMVVVAAMHLQTPSTDSTGEMRSLELQQLRRQLDVFASPDDYVLIGGDFNINLAPEKPRAPYERYIFEGTFPSRSLVLKAINRTSFQTGFALHQYEDAVHGEVTGVAYSLGSRTLLDVAGSADQGGCVTSKASGRAMMIDYVFADSRLLRNMKHAGVCMQHKPQLEPEAIPDVNHPTPVEFSDHFALTALLHLPHAAQV